MVGWGVAGQGGAEGLATRRQLTSCVLDQAKHFTPFDQARGAGHAANMGRQVKLAHRTKKYTAAAGISAP